MSGLLITETDLQILECYCISAPKNIVEVVRNGKLLIGNHLHTKQNLCYAGKLWSDHVVENA